MQDLVRKLTQQAINQRVGTLSGILGSSIPSLSGIDNQNATAPYRIGMWPIISKEHPEIAMGIASVAALLLDSIVGIHVYRLFAKLMGEPTNHEWTINNSQFAIDDWSIEGLNENAALWGSLEKDASGYQLVIYLESDFDIDRTEPYEFTLVRASLRELINDLPSVIRNVISTLAPDLVVSSEILDELWYQSNISLNDEALKKYLQWAFDRDLLFLLRMWGQPWGKGHLDAEFSQLLSMVENSVEDKFPIWLVSSSLSSQIKPAYSPYSTDMVDALSRHYLSFQGNPVAAARIGAALARTGYLPHALDLLEQTLSLSKDSPFAWVTLAQLYRAANQAYSALITYQRAIRCDQESESLYLDYADLVHSLLSNGLRLEDFNEDTENSRTSSLTRTQDQLDYLFAKDDNPMRMEVIGAYEAALKIKPDSPDVILQLISQMVLIPDIEHAETFWHWLEKLIELDESGEMVHIAIDSCYGIVPLQRAIKYLEEFKEFVPNRIDVRINLISALIADEDLVTAEQELNAAKSIVTNIRDEGEIERLLLVVRKPEFESIYGELADRIDGGGKVTAGEGEFLEDVLDEAPHFARTYVLLAAVYHEWGDEDDSIGVLLDGLDHVPNSPDILGKLGQYLWEQGEKELGLGYLKQGLESHPNNVLLLSVTGRFLFDMGDEESAKKLLLRAESIDPYHLSLRETRRYIAQAVSSDIDRDS